MTQKNSGPAPDRGETDVAKLPKLRNILIVVDEYTGGIRDHIRSEIEFLTQNGARVHLFTDRPLIIGEDDGFSSINVLKPSLQGQPWTVSLRGLQQIQSVARAHQIDLIHLESPSNLVRKHQFGSNIAQFERSYGSKQHDHIILSNGEVIEFCDPRIQNIKATLEEMFDLKILHHSLNFYGVKNEEK